MVCVSYAKAVFLRRTEDTGKMIVQPLLGDGSNMVVPHWFYVSDQVIASTCYNWHGLGFMKGFETSRDKLPKYFQKTRWLTDWELTFELEEKERARGTVGRTERVERAERVEKLVCV